MTKNKKKQPVKKVTAKKVKVLKVTPLEPDKHLVELEIEGLPVPVPSDPPPLEPLELDAPVEHPWLTWLKSIW